MGFFTSKSEVRKYFRILDSVLKNETDMRCLRRSREKDYTAPHSFSGPEQPKEPEKESKKAISKAAYIQCAQKTAFSLN